MKKKDSKIIDLKKHSKKSTSKYKLFKTKNVLDMKSYFQKETSTKETSKPSEHQATLNNVIPFPKNKITAKKTTQTHTNNLIFLHNHIKRRRPEAPLNEDASFSTPQAPFVNTQRAVAAVASVFIMVFVFSLFQKTENTDLITQNATPNSSRQIASNPSPISKVFKTLKEFFHSESPAKRTLQSLSSPQSSLSPLFIQGRKPTKEEQEQGF